MHSQIVKKDCTKTKEFNYFLASDIHFGNKGQDTKLLKQEFEKAADLKCDIFINGDWGEFILPGDTKRHTNSAMKYEGDNISNRTVEEAFKFLKPYKEFIKMIGSGNHETSMGKFHSYDPTSALIFLLNNDGGQVQHGQYSGFISIKYTTYKKGTSRFVIYYNHGQGTSAEVTKNIIGLNRHMNSKNADVTWLSHSHTKMLVPGEICLELDKNDNVVEKKKYGLITGCYLKNVNSYNALDEGYKLSFAEERMRTNQQQGGVIMNHLIIDREIKTTFII